MNYMYFGFPRRRDQEDGPLPRRDLERARAWHWQEVFHTGVARRRRSLVVPRTLPRVQKAAHLPSGNRVLLIEISI